MKNNKIRLKDWHYILIIFLLTCVFFSKVILNPDMMIAGSDTVRTFSYGFYFEQDAYNEYKELPLWDPYIFSGFPMIARVQMARYYPLNLLHMFFYGDQFYGYYYLIHIFIAGLTMYFFTRSLKLGMFGSFMSAVIFMFNANLVVRIEGHLSVVAAYSLMPLAFLVFELMMQKRRVLYSLLLGVVLAIQFLGGHSQYWFYSLFGLLIYALIRIISSYVKSKKSERATNAATHVSYVTLSMIIMILLSSILLFPLLEMTQFFSKGYLNNGRELQGSNYEYVTSHSMPPRHLVNYLIPDLFGDERAYWGAPNMAELSAYMGILSLILAIAALFFIRNLYTRICQKPPVGGRWHVYIIKCFRWFLSMFRIFQRSKSESSRACHQSETGWKILTFLVIIIISLILAMGKFTPLFSLFYKFVPGFNLFRSPSRMLMLTNFSLAVLAGFGASLLTKKLQNNEKTKFNKVIKVISIVLLISVVSALGVSVAKESLLSVGEKVLNRMYYETYADSFFVQQNSYESLVERMEIAHHTMIRALIIFNIALAASLLVLFLRIRKNAGAAAIMALVVVVVIVDLWWFGLDSVNVTDPKTVYGTTPEIDYLLDDSSYYRVYSLSEDLTPPHILIRHHIPHVMGYASMRIDHYFDFLTAMMNLTDDPHYKKRLALSTVYPNNVDETYTPKLLGMLNVKYIASKEELSNDYYVLLKKTENAFIYENREFLPRAYIIRDARVMGDELEIVDYMRSGSFDPGKEIILEKEPSGVSLSNEGTFKEAEISYFSPNRVVIDVSLDSPGFLVYSDVWYPGWKAYDNGKRINIYKTSLTLKSIYLEKGDHAVEFVFDPASYRVGKLVTLSTAMLVAIMLLVLLFTGVKNVE